MTLQEQLARELHDALKERQAVRVSVLRLLGAHVKNEELAKRSGPLTDEDVLRLVQQEVKKRKEAAAQYRAGNRPERADQEDAERQILETYLPVQLSDADIEHIVRETVDAAGASGQAAVGRVMGAVMEKMRGRADGARVRAAVTRVLSSG